MEPDSVFPLERNAKNVPYDEHRLLDDLKGNPFRSGTRKMFPMTNRGDVFMQTKKARRLLVIERASAGKSTVREAGERLGVSSRHVIRLKNRFRREGASGLAHK